MRPLVRGIRGRLLLVTVLAVAAALVALTAAFNIALERTLERNADKVLRERATAELRTLRPEGGRLHLGEAPDQGAVDSAVWVFSGGRTVEAPNRGHSLDPTARSLTHGGARYLTVSATDTRLYAEPILVNGRRLGTVVVAGSLAPLEQTERTALIGSVALVIGLLLAVVVGAFRLVSSALRPVARMTREAAAWSEHDLDRRFALGEPYDELTGLGATLDELLDRIATSLRRERRFSAEISHELRTPLASIVAESDLALRRERDPEAYRASLALVGRHAKQLTRTVDALLAAARQESGTRGTADAYRAAADTVEACCALAAKRGVAVDAEQPDASIRIGVDEDFAQRILQPVVENACRFARSRVAITIARDGARILYVIEDDGPGVTANERERIFEPGVRGAGRSADDGAGLGLALARRLARSASGDVVAAGDGAGGRFVVSLPAH